MDDFWLLLWAVLPPLLFLGYYYYRVPHTPPLSSLLWLFVVGAISGFIALGLQYIVDSLANSIFHWRRIERSLFGVSLRQILEIGPIEEGCKLLAVITAKSYFQRRLTLSPSSYFFFTIAAALGFTAQENWIYLYHGTATIFDRTITTPVHTTFSAPWGYALGIYLSQRVHLNHYRIFFIKSWLGSVFLHALVNILSSSGRYPPPLNFLTYGLFPLLLWMFWRIEQLLRQVQNKAPIRLISAITPQYRYWQRGLALFALILGGNAIFGLLLLARIISPLSLAKIFSPDFFWLIMSRFLINLAFGALAWLIYLYLRFADR